MNYYNNYYTDSRELTPLVKNNDRKLFFRIVRPEGHYDIHCSVQDRKIVGTFSFYNNHVFHDESTILEEEFDTESECVDRYAQLINASWILPGNVSTQDMCRPVKERDKIIDALNHDTRKKIYRQRKGKKFYITLTFNQNACDSWVINHIHGSRVQVYDLNHKLVTEEHFDCDHVWAGVQRYYFYLHHFDEAYMEIYL